MKLLRIWQTCPSVRVVHFMSQEVSVSDTIYSFDTSYNTLGTIAGLEQFKQFPDFVAVKVTPQPGTERDHYIVCVVEVKRDDETEAKAKDQMEAYMERAAYLP